MRATFFGSLLLLAYAYLGYPLLAGLLARLWPRPHQKAEGPGVEPSISLIILAYNEERDLARKLENALALDYPREKLEILVASDGSSDGTDAIARRFADRGVALYRADEHPGKTETTNRAVLHTNGEILVFSDATGAYDPGALRALARNFADPDVGAVTGRVTYDYPESAAAQGFRVYQRLVVYARQAESVWGTETSVSGSICAIRRELFTSLPSHLDFDMAHPLHVALAGLRTVYEPDAVSVEEARSSSRSEFSARVRMAILAYSFVPYLLRRSAQIRRASYAFQMVSHKLLRWLAPLLLVTLAVSTVALIPTLAAARFMAVAQLGLYGAAALAWRWPVRGLAGRALGVALFFVTLHLAFLKGFVQVLRGERMGRWQPER